MSVTITKQQFENVIDAIESLAEDIKQLHNRLTLLETESQKSEPEKDIENEDLVTELYDSVETLNEQQARTVAAIKELGRLVSSDQAATNSQVNVNPEGKGYWKDMNNPLLTSAVTKYLDEKELTDKEITIMLQYLKLFVDGDTDTEVEESKEGIDLLLSERIQ